MTKRPLKDKLSAGERHKRFIETAKKVEASENIEDFDKAFMKVARPALAKRETTQK
jgi:hypothetical protein